MSIAKCVVKLKDSHGTGHSATVYAETLYEAVILGLKKLEQVGWESDDDKTIGQVEVEIHHEPTRHVVDVPKLLKWVEDSSMSMSPAQDFRREKLRKLLGVKKRERTKR
jgi:hypothetical protein